MRVPVKNVGAREGDEVVQLYARYVDDKSPISVVQPLHSLVMFRRVHLGAGASTPVELSFPAARLRRWDVAKNAYVVPSGRYELQIGAASDDIRGRATVEIGS